MKDIKQWDKDKLIGKAVDYQSIIGKTPLIPTQVTSEPWQLGDYWVVNVKGILGGVDVGHVFYRRALTNNQIDVGQHTIGLENGEERNFFGAGSNGQDRQDLNVLEGYGYAMSVDSPDWSGDDKVFTLTDKGKKVITKAFKRRNIIKDLQKHNPGACAKTLKLMADELEVKRA